MARTRGWVQESAKLRRAKKGFVPTESDRFLFTYHLHRLAPGNTSRWPCFCPFSGLAISFSLNLARRRLSILEVPWKSPRKKVIKQKSRLRRGLVVKQSISAPWTKKGAWMVKSVALIWVCLYFGDPKNGKPVFLSL